MWSCSNSWLETSSSMTHVTHVNPCQPMINKPWLTKNPRGFPPASDVSCYHTGTVPNDQQPSFLNPRLTLDIIGQVMQVLLSSEVKQLCLAKATVPSGLSSLSRFFLIKGTILRILVTYHDTSHKPLSDLSAQEPLHRLLGVPKPPAR